MKKKKRNIYRPQTKRKKLVIQVPLNKIFKDNNIKFKENSSEQLIIEECYNSKCKAVRKLYVDKNTGRYICFKCEEKGGPVEFLEKALKISRSKAYNMISPPETRRAKLSDMKDSIDNLAVDDYGVNLEKPTDPVKMPSLCRLLDKKKDEKAWNYLLGRGYSDEIINALKLMIIPYEPIENFQKAWGFFKDKLNYSDEDLGNKDNLTEVQKNNREDLLNHIINCGRIFFPLYVNDNIHGYLARDYTDGLLAEYAKKNNRDYIKVLNTKGVSFRSHYVWNYDNAKNSETLIIAEGATSAIKCGIDRSIALLGKLATKGQIKLIKKTKAKKIIFCLDVGTENEQKKIMNMLKLAYPQAIYTVELPKRYQFKNKIDHEELLRIKRFLKIDEIKVLSDNEILFEASYVKRLRDLRDNRAKDMKVSDNDRKFLKAWLKTGDFLDPGDYTFEEMNEFIKKAKPLFKKRNTLL